MSFQIMRNGKLVYLNAQEEMDLHEMASEWHTRLPMWAVRQRKMLDKIIDLIGDDELPCDRGNNGDPCGSGDCRKCTKKLELNKE